MKRFVAVILFLILLSATNFGVAKSLSRNVDIQADLFELDAKENIVVASGNVIVKQKDVTLYGKKAFYNQKKQFIRVIDGVRIVKGTMLLTCNQAQADGMKDVIKAIGDVYFTFSNIKGKADNAEYNLRLQRIYLKGSPRAWKDKDRISGNLIYVDMEKEKIITEGKAKVIISEESLKK